MGLKEMIEKKRAEDAAKKAQEASQKPAPIVKMEPSKPAPAAGPLARFNLPSRPSQTVVAQRSRDVPVQPNLEGKKNEKISTPAPSQTPPKQTPENGNGGKVVENGASNSHKGNGATSTNPAGPASASVAGIGQPSEPPAGLEELRKNIAFLSANIEHKELVGQVVRRVLIDLKKNPQFSTHMTDVDFNTITRAFRRSAVVAARKKTEQREVKAKKKKEDNEFGDFMAASGMKDFDLG